MAKQGIEKCREVLVSPVTLQIVESTDTRGVATCQARLVVGPDDLITHDIGDPQGSYVDALVQIAKAFE